MPADPLRTRIGDAERDAAVAALGEHFAVGRISPEELEERSATAWAARSHADLAPVFADLPPPHGRPPLVPPPAAGQRASGVRRPALPWLPVLLLGVGLTVLTHLPFLVLAVAVLVVAAKVRRHGRSLLGSQHCAGHTSGSRREVRGTCS